GREGLLRHGAAGHGLHRAVQAERQVLLAEVVQRERDRGGLAGQQAHALEALTAAALLARLGVHAEAEVADGRVAHVDERPGQAAGQARTEVHLALEAEVFHRDVLWLAMRVELREPRGAQPAGLMASAAGFATGRLVRPCSSSHFAVGWETSISRP